MTHILDKASYEEAIAATRDQRMGWWRDAKFGMFIHFGLYSILGRHEWAQAFEGIPREEYARLADEFRPEQGCCRQWARLAREAGMKYAVLTTRHHEGFSLWDSKVNPFNSMNYGCKRDIVREFVDACRAEGLRIGFYTSLMDWRHPDGAACAYDRAARERFLDYIETLNTELLTNYGKIDILWYDVASPMRSAEGWESLERNQRLRALQPDIIINDRSLLPEDFGTPEGSIRPGERDWEACMTFNDLSWGYLDDVQTLPYAYTAHRILKMLHRCARDGGNLLLNIGPRPDGSVPQDAIKPLRQVGAWLERNGVAFYGRDRGVTKDFAPMGTGIAGATISPDHRHVYLWCWVYPNRRELAISGYFTRPVSVSVLSTGEKVPFEYDGKRIILHDLPETNPDSLGVTVLDMTFDREPEYHLFACYPQLGGKVY